MFIKRYAVPTAILLALMLLFVSCGFPPTSASPPNHENSAFTETAEATGNAGPPRALGLLGDDPEEVYSLMRSGNSDASGLPAIYDNSAAYPPVGDQGAQGSCVGWAVAYALKSYQENTGGNNYNDSNKFSPAYVYNQINDGVDCGSRISDAMNLLVGQGVCSLSDMPYSDWDYLTQPNETQRQQAYEHRNASYYTLSGINDIKQAIIAHGGVVVGVPVYPSFNSVTHGAPVYSDASGTASGSHAICLVGYDDSMQAFKFINSWGPDWGISGYGYVSYDIICRDGNYGYAMRAYKKAESSFTVQFNSGGGTGEMASVSGAAGQSITLPKSAFSNGGAKFKGWYVYSTAMDGWLYAKGTDIRYFRTGNQPEGWDRALVPDGATRNDLGAMDNDVVIMSAVWESENAYTVKFDNNGGEGLMTEITVIDGNDWYLPNNQFTKDGMVCLGWYVYSVKLDSRVYEYDNSLYFYKTNSAPTGAKIKIFEEGAKTTGLSPEKNDTLILLAAWEPTETFTIVFSSDRGAGYMEPLSVGAAQAFTVPQCGFTKEGETFAGWLVYFCDVNGYLVERASKNGPTEYWYTTDNKIPNGMELSILQPGGINAFPFTEPNGIVYFIAEWE